MEQIISKLEILHEVYTNLNQIDSIFFDSDAGEHLNKINQQLDFLEKKIFMLKLDPNKCSQTLLNIKKNNLIAKNLFLYYFYLNKVID